MPKLLFKNPANASSAFGLKPGCNHIGRSAENDWCLADPSVSACHCEITVRDEEVHVTDLQSTNGTFIGDRRIQSGQLLPGEVLRLGSVELVLEIPPVVAIPDLPRPPVLEQTYLRDGSPACLRHAQQAALWTCTKCGFCLCNDCVRVLKRVGGSRAMRFCTECGGVCQPVEGLPATTPQQRDFFRSLMRWFGWKKERRRRVSRRKNP